MISELDFNEASKEGTYVVEREHAVSLLPELERKIYLYLVHLDLEEYLQNQDDKTPLQRTAEHFGISRQDVKSIAMNAHQLINELLNK